MIESRTKMLKNQRLFYFGYNTMDDRKVFKTVLYLQCLNIFLLFVRDFPEYGITQNFTFNDFLHHIFHCCSFYIMGDFRNIFLICTAEVDGCFFDIFIFFYYFRLFIPLK